MNICYSCVDYFHCMRADASYFDGCEEYMGNSNPTLFSVADYAASHPVVIDSPENRYNYGLLSEEVIENAYGNVEIKIIDSDHVPDDVVKTVSENFDESDAITSYATFQANGANIYIGIWE